MARLDLLIGFVNIFIIKGETKSISFANGEILLDILI